MRCLGEPRRHDTQGQCLGRKTQGLARLGAVLQLAFVGMMPGTPTKERQRALVIQASTPWSRPSTWCPRPPAWARCPSQLMLRALGHGGALATPSRPAPPGEPRPFPELSHFGPHVLGCAPGMEIVQTSLSHGFEDLTRPLRADSPGAEAHSSASTLGFASSRDCW